MNWFLIIMFIVLIVLCLVNASMPKYENEALGMHLEKIHFWVSVVGVYALVKLIEEVIKISFILSAGYELEMVLQHIFNQAF